MHIRDINISLRPAGGMFGAPLPEMAMGFCPLFLARDSDAAFELSCFPLWTAFYENDMKGEERRGRVI